VESNPFRFEQGDCHASNFRTKNSNDCGTAVTLGTQDIYGH